MRRRTFITLLGGAAVAWPGVTRAQRQPMPVIGYLRSGSRAASSQVEAAFRQGLSSMGFIEGRNVAIDYQYAENQNDRLVMVKSATTTIPVVFRIGGDPIQLGLVTSLSRPDGNMTGVSFLGTATGAIRLQMMREAVPNAAVMGLLVNPANPNAELDTQEAQNAARKLGLELHVVGASNAQEIDTAFATLIQQRAHALVIDGDTLFSNRRQQLTALTVHHTMPAIYAFREFPDAGGLMSYGASNVDADRLGGIYVGRILKGDKPADLPVQQAVKVELIINLITAKVLGITLPPTLLARADEVIE